MHTGATYLRYLGKLLQALGAHASWAADETVQVLDTLPTRPLSEQCSALAEVFARIAELPQARDFGFVVGRAIPITAFGPPTLGLAVAPTAREALKLVADSSWLELPLLRYEFEPQTSGAAYFAIRFRCAIDHGAEALLTSAVVTAVQKELQTITRCRAVITRVELTSASQAYAPMYESRLGLPVQLGAPFNRVLIPREVLDAHNPHADIETYEEMVRNCAAALKEARNALSVKERVLEQLAANIAAPPSIAELAAQLRLSPRQLRFALGKEGVSYRELVRRARIEQAETLLRDARLPVAHVAERLGYADVAAFTHSFRRWTGKAPSQLREPRSGTRS
ncbi:MAG TPA: helix-turn-helix domain-containing protein [Solimonas sp.]|nr:helix-turn-helix domain-containing protein [Solimonas sp.]